DAYDTAVNLTQQLAYAASNVIPDFSSTKLDTNNQIAVKEALADYLQTDVNVNNLLQSYTGDWPYIYDVAIVDVKNKALLHTNPDLVGKEIEARPDFKEKVVKARFREQIRLVFGPAAVYDVTDPLKMNGAPFGIIRIGMDTSFLKNEIRGEL